MDTLVQAAVYEQVWAIVGASNDRSKFGNRIFRDLRAAGYTVYPVNPSEEAIEGVPSFARLQNLPEPPAVVDVVVPATVGMQILDDAVEVGARYFWLQPGAESDDLLAKAATSSIAVIYDRCAMVEKIRWPDHPRHDD